MIIDCYFIDFKQIYSEYVLIMLLDWRIDPSAGSLSKFINSSFIF